MPSFINGHTLKMWLKNVSRFPTLQKPLRYLELGLQLLKLQIFLCVPCSLTQTRSGYGAGNIYSCLEELCAPSWIIFPAFTNQTMLQEPLDRFRKFLFILQELWGSRLSAWSNYSCIYKGNPRGCCGSIVALSFLSPFSLSRSADPAWPEEQQRQSSTPSSPAWEPSQPEVWPSPSH